MIPALGAVDSLTLVTKGPELEGKKQDYVCNMHVFGKDKSPSKAYVAVVKKR